MARTLGQAGHYASQEHARKEKQMLLTGLIGAAMTFWVSGFMFGFLFYRKVFWISTAVQVSVLVFILLARRWFFRKIDELDNERRQWRKGADGEVLVGRKLDEFPDNFYIVHDLPTDSGNLDHIVIGPTGVFALDTKSWRGVVSADGKGELLNNRRFEKPYVKQLVGSIMGVKDRIKALAPGLDPYVQAVFVFTSARVDAGWGTTGSAHCIRDDQLYSYIVEDTKRKKLADKDVKAIARAFKALAQMDPTFPEKTKVPDKTPAVRATTAQPVHTAA